MTKPKEFWIKKGISCGHQWGNTSDIILENPSEGYVHVIEKSVYDKLVKTLLKTRMDINQTGGILTSDFIDMTLIELGELND